MNLCNYDHDEVCFEGRKCPVCDIMNAHRLQLDAWDDKISELENQISELEYELEQARNND